MSKYKKQDLIEEDSKLILERSLDRNFFIVSDFGKKDKYPNIDGQIRLRDGKGNYLNRYLHYQLKGAEKFKNNGSTDFCVGTYLTFHNETRLQFCSSQSF